jgi:UrcA family protein
MKSKVIAMLLVSVLSLPCAFAVGPSEIIKFQDLNVDTPAGVEALYTRIDAAAKRICAESDPSMLQAVAPCIWRTVAKAVKEVNVPALTAYARTKSKGVSDALIASR